MQNDMHKNTGSVFTLILICVFVSINLIAQDRNLEDEQLIRQARKQSNEAILKKDSNALAEIWTDDYHLLSSRNFELSGKENNRHLFAEDFTSPNSKVFVRSTTQYRNISRNGIWLRRMVNGPGAGKNPTEK